MTKPQSSVIISEFGSYLHFASLPLLLFQIKVPDPGDLCYQGYEVTKVTRVTGVTMAIKGSSPHQIQGYAVTGLPACGNFVFNFLELKGYEVTKVTKVTGVTMVIKFKITKLQGYQRVELFSSLF